MTHHLGARDFQSIREAWSRSWLRIVTDRHEAWAVMPVEEGITEGGYLLPDPIHVVTAYNPDCIPHTEAENQRRHQEMDDWIHDHDLPLWEGTGFASDGGWSEEGFALVGLSRMEALAVGRRWGQRAIWEWNAEALLTLDCDGSNESSYGWVRAPLPCRPPFLPGGLVPPCQ
ncbi:MAG: DUF3293 domain-containing protein [Planctomycetota bacterium]|nr:DUF3293 domain-containing protein [Planctomycetota bacterium]